MWTVSVKAAQSELNESDGRRPGGRRFFSTLVPGSGSFQLSDLAGLGYGLLLRFWVVFTIAFPLP